MRNSMKFSLLAVLVLLTVGLQAQVSVGLRGGLLNSKWAYSGDGTDSIGDYIKSRTGLIGGVVMEIRFNKGFAIQPELNWSQKGTTSEISGDVLGQSFSAINRIRINYVEVPILAKAGFAFGPARFDFLGGPSFAYAVNGKEYFKSDFFGVVTEETNDIDFDDSDYDEFNRTDVGLQLGGALSLGMGNTRFFLDGRYLYGISNLINDNSDDDIKVYNRGSALTAGVLVGF